MTEGFELLGCDFRNQSAVKKLQESGLLRWKKQRIADRWRIVNSLQRVAQRLRITVSFGACRGVSDFEFQFNVNNATFGGFAPDCPLQFPSLLPVYDLICFHKSELVR